MRKFLKCLVFISIVACSQSPSEVVYRTPGDGESGVYVENRAGAYRETPKGTVVRDLRASDGDGYREVDLNRQPPSQEIVRSRSGNVTEIIVAEGDTVYNLSKRYNVNQDELIRANRLGSSGLIKVGDTLVIPNNSSNPVVEKQPPQKPSKITYTVKSGDTLSGIASSHDTTTKDVAVANNLNEPYRIHPGQKLSIYPGVAGAAATPTSAVKSPAPADKKDDSSTIVLSNKTNKFIWPLKGNVISQFGNKENGLFNDGMNIAAPAGTNFIAAEDGEVAYVGNELRGYGTLILVKHSDNWISAYAHCDSLKVSKGDVVKKGETLGTVGSTGNVNTPQLYFSLRNGRKAVNPADYLK